MDFIQASQPMMYAGGGGSFNEAGNGVTPGSFIAPTANSASAPQSQRGYTVANGKLVGPDGNPVNQAFLDANGLSYGTATGVLQDFNGNEVDPASLQSQQITDAAGNPTGGTVLNPNLPSNFSSATPEQQAAYISNNKQQQQAADSFSAGHPSTTWSGGVRWAAENTLPLLLGADFGGAGVAGDAGAAGGEAGGAGASLGGGEVGLGGDTLGGTGAMAGDTSGLTGAGGLSGAQTGGTTAGAAAGTSAGGGGGLLGTGITGNQALLGGTIASSLIGAGAAKSAANTQANAANNATAAQLAMFNTINNQNAPFLQAGQNALPLIAAGFGGPSAGGINSGQFTHQFDANDLKTNLAPNYQFQLDQGLGATKNAANLQTGLLSGNTLKGVNDYAQNFAGNAYQNAFNNYNTNQSNIFNRLAAVAGFGQTANQTVAGAGAPISAGLANTITGAGQAQASGTVGAANAITGGLNNALSWYQLQNLLSRNQTGSSSLSS